MTYEEVKKIRNNGQVDHPNIRELQELIDIAIEKQIPKKPHFEGDGYWNGALVYDTWVCPNCDTDYEVETDKYKYCPNCGQKIDWSEEE